MRSLAQRHVSDASYSSSAPAEHEASKEEEEPSVTTGAHLEDRYEVGDVIGCGHFATVRRGVNRESGEAVAIKTIAKSRTDASTIRREIAIQRMVGAHENMVGLRDVFETVPPVLKESAYGLGCTTWEVVRNVVLPYTRVGVIGGVMLGLGRALGETMAVTFMIGNANRLAPSLFAPGNSIASTLANEFAEADPALHVPALFALGLLLFVITFFVLAAARWLTARGTRRAGI
jgi:hypothetical protein